MYSSFSELFQFHKFLFWKFSKAIRLFDNGVLTAVSNEKGKGKGR
jgi:hypothetical protein